MNDKTTVIERLKNGWNAFKNRDPTKHKFIPYTSMGFSYRNDRLRLSGGNEKSIITAIHNRIAMDVAALTFKHVMLDDNGRYKDDMDTSLNTCLTLEANIDQTYRNFIQDAVLTMLNNGVVVLAPIDTSKDPALTDEFDIETLRVGTVVTWYPSQVLISAYNDQSGQREELLLDKKHTGIIENPFYVVMNEPNSVMQRLVRKLNLLDVLDEHKNPTKLDLIIQLPYTIRSKTRQQQAEERRNDIANQLSSSEYGIAYADNTEKIIQLNRSVENNLMPQIEYLTNMLYSQLGITQDVLNGTANEQTMMNYQNRIIEPIASAFVLEMKRKFLSKSAITERKESIEFFVDPFKLVSVNCIAEIADKFTRNEITSTNEIRQAIGMIPSSDPRADELRNKNLSEPYRPNNSRDSEYGDKQILKDKEEFQNGI